MVVSAPRYRTQADPDGVIHVSDDGDFNEPRGRRSHSKRSHLKVVDLTDFSINDPSQNYGMKKDDNCRDPPTRSNYATSSRGSNKLFPDIVNEAPGVRPYSPQTRGCSSVAKSNSFAAREEYGTPAFNSDDDFHEVISVESVIIKGIASPEKNREPSPRHYTEEAKEKTGTYTARHRVHEIKMMHMKRKNAVPKAETVDRDDSSELHDVQAIRDSDMAQRVSPKKLSEPSETSDESPEPIEDNDIEDDDDEVEHLDAVDAEPLEPTQPPINSRRGAAVDDEQVNEAVETRKNGTQPPINSRRGAAVDDEQVNEAVETRKNGGDDERHMSLPSAVPNSSTANKMEARDAEKPMSDNGNIFSSFMNTFTCHGSQPSDEDGPVVAFVRCSKMTTTKKQKEETSQQDDDDNNSVLGPKGFGDLASLPSMEESIFQKAGDGDNESLSSKVSRLSMKTEYLGNAVDSKIKDIENEKQRGGKDGDMDVADPDIKKLTHDLNEAAKTYGPFHMKCAQLTSELAEKFTEKKSFKKALELQRRVVAIYSTKLGDHHEDALDAKVRLGKCLEDAEEYDDSISTFYEVMAMRRVLKGEKDPSTADAMVQIANCLRKKGQYMQAIRELKRGLKVYRESLGDSNPSVASTVDEIASLYVVLGDFDKSAAILEEVVKLKAATLGMQNKQVASSLVELATSYECSEDFERAIKALKKAYKIYTDLDGFSSEDATSTLHRIALIYQASGDINKAAIAYLGVLRGKKQLLGDDHLEVAETYYRLGVCLRETNQLDKALKCMKEALPILVGKGKNIHDVDMIAEVMHEMALLYKTKRQLTEAAKIFKQELTVRRKIGQPDYPCIAKTLNHLGVTEYEMKMHRRALKHLLEVLTIFQERQEQGIDFAEALYNIGLVFEAVRNKERAYEAFLEAARVFKANGYANDHPHLVKAVSKAKRLAKK